jgi:uncharacterized membrane protein YgcG
MSGWSGRLGRRRRPEGLAEPGLGSLLQTLTAPPTRAELGEEYEIRALFRAARAVGEPAVLAAGDTAGHDTDRDGVHGRRASRLGLTLNLAAAAAVVAGTLIGVNALRPEPPVLPGDGAGNVAPVSPTVAGGGSGAATTAPPTVKDANPGTRATSTRDPALRTTSPGAGGSENCPAQPTREPGTNQSQPGDVPPQDAPSGAQPRSGTGGRVACGDTDFPTRAQQPTRDAGAPTAPQSDPTPPPPQGDANGSGSGSGSGSGYGSGSGSGPGGGSADGSGGESSGDQPQAQDGDPAP